MSKLNTHENPDYGEPIPTPEDMVGKLTNLAWSASGWDNYGVGAVIVRKPKKTGDVPKVMAVGLSTVNRISRYKDDIMDTYTDGHAEMNALRSFYHIRDGAKSNMTKAEWEKEFDPNNYEMWVNLQPCLMCASAICHAHMPTKYIAPDDVIPPPDAVYAGQINREIREQMLRLIKRADGKLDGAFRDAVFDNEQHVAAALEPFDVTKDAVRAAKKARETKRGDRTIDVLSDPNADAVKIAIAKQVADYENVFGYRGESACDHTILSMVAERAISSRNKVYKEGINGHKKGENKGNDENACAVVDSHNVVWFVVGDHTGEDNPLRTPLLRAMKRVEKIREHVPPQLRRFLPHPGEFTYVLYKEPGMLEAARSNSLYPKAGAIKYLREDPKHGVVSTGQLENMGDFYLVGHGLNKAFEKVPVKQEEIDRIIRETQSVMGDSSHVGHKRQNGKSRF